MSRHCESISQVFKRLNLPGTPTPGTISSDVETIDSATAALEALRAFRGEGWIICALRKETTYLPDEDGLAGVKYPMSAELVNGDKSLLLKANGEGSWSLTRFTLESDDAGIVLEREFLGRDGRSLRYQVAYARTPIGRPDAELLGESEPSSEQISPLRHLELRPSASRFIGFAEIQSQS